MEKIYDNVVLIGRFQPVTVAHKELIRLAGSLTHTVNVIVGSANQPRTFKNPWSSNERSLMIQETIREIQEDSGLEFDYVIDHNPDSMYNHQAWATRVQQIVAKHTTSDSKIGIIGHKKDESSFYLDMFPQWKSIDVPLLEPLNATDVRDTYFRRNANLRFIDGVVPDSVFKFLKGFSTTEDYQQIIREREFVENYKKQFASLPYPPVFVTVDAVVVQSGHVLMIKRRSEPGKGLWAIPGGFLNAATDTSVQDAMIRELREETGIKVPAPVLVGSIKSSKVFDAIGRSTRGRTITHAFNIVLPDGPLPKVKGMDDAEKARWVPIADVDPSACYEDHHDIIQHFVGGL
jgi:bifunctional NMN adenylyltransferase/nudix hydrolase